MDFPASGTASDSRSRTASTSSEVRALFVSIRSSSGVRDKVGPTHRLGQHRLVEEVEQKVTSTVYDSAEAAALQKGRSAKTSWVYSAFQRLAFWEVCRSCLPGLYSAWVVLSWQ